MRSSMSYFTNYKMNDKHHFRFRISHLMSPIEVFNTLVLDKVDLLLEIDLIFFNVSYFKYNMIV